MPFSRSYRRYRGRARRTRNMGGIRKGFRGQRYRRPMTSGRVRRIIDAELKFRDLSVGPVAIPTITGFVSPITTGIGLGDGASARTGNWIKPVTWYGTFTIKGNADDVVNDTVMYRVIVVCWKENESQNAVTLAALMADTAAPHQGFDVTNKGQFSILYSRTGILSTSVDNPNHQKIHKFYVKPPLKCLYQDANEKNNQLFLLAYSDVAAAENPPTMDFDTRLRYTDS